MSPTFAIRAFAVCLFLAMPDISVLAQCPSNDGEPQNAKIIVYTSESFSASLVGFAEFTNPSSPARFYRRKTVTGDRTYHVYESPTDCSALMGIHKSIYDLTCQYDATSGVLTSVNNSILDYYKNTGPVPLGVSCSEAVSGTLTQTTAVDVFGTGNCEAYAWYDSGYRALQRTGTVTTQLDDEDTETDAIKRAVKTSGSSNTAFLTSRTGQNFSGCNVRYRATFDIACEGEYDVVVTYATKPHGSGTVTGGDRQVVRKILKPGEHTVTGDIRVTERDTDYTVVSIELRKPCGDKPPGEPDFRVGSVHAELSLGLGARQESAGFLSLKADTITSAIYLPATLTVTTSDSGTETIRDAAAALRQIKAPQALADVVTLDASAYEVRFYTPDQAGAQDPGTMVYAVSGTPYVVFKFENPDIGQTTRLRITETRGAITRVNEYSYDAGTTTWSLSRGNNLRQESLAITTSGADTTKTTTIREGDNTVVSKTAKTYRAFPWDEELVSEVLDPDTAALTTTFTFYDNAGTDGANYGRLKLRANSDGSWERHTYDSTGRTIKTVRPYLNAVSTAAENLCRVTENTYSSLADTDGDGTVEQLTNTIETTLAQETSRSYTIEWSKPVTLAAESFTRRTDIRCTVAGAAWNAATNLVTETLAYGSGPFNGRTRRVLNPDGTAILTTYVLDASGQQTAIIKSGVPNAAFDDITDGTRTTTFTSAQGQVVGKSITDIASGLTLSAWTATQFDALGRPTRLDHADGTYETRDYACCGLASSRDRSGAVTSYLYDALGRQTHVTRNGITTRTAYDADGRVKSVTRIGTDASEMVQGSSTYDLAGRQSERRDALDRLTTLGETFDTASGETTRTTTLVAPDPPGGGGTPDGGTLIEVTARDGSRLSVTGTAATPRNFEHGVESGQLFTKETLVGEGGATTEWIKTFNDFAGRTSREERPSVSGSPTVTLTFTYNSLGQLVAQSDPDGVATLFAYNARGEQDVVAVDVNGNGVIDFHGTDRITLTVRTVSTRDTFTVQRSTTQIWETEGQDTPVSISISEQSADGLRSWQTVRGLTTGAVTSFDGSGGRTETVTAPEGTVVTRVYLQDRLQSTSTTHPSLGTLGSATYAHDPHGRLQSMTDARNGATTYTYFADDQLHTVTTPDPDPARSGPGYDPQTTTFGYDPAGRQNSITHPDGGVVTTEYYPTGQVKKTFGVRTYPVEYTYDSQGRVKTLTTWQNFASAAGAAFTTWNYDPQRGFLLNKQYHDNTGPSYTYKPSGRLQSRTWTRGIVTTYGYSEAGDIETVDYSDSTPDATIQYDRVGRPKTITDGAGTRTLSYHASGQLQDEIYSAGLMSGLSVTRGFDSLARLGSAFALSAASVLNQIGYSYDSASRLDTVTNGTNTATYGYLPNSPLVGTVTFKQSGATRLTTTKIYDNLNRLASISSAPSASSALNHSYIYNSANQRTKLSREDNAYWDYDYDPLGQLTSAKKSLPGGVPMLGHDFGYAFDDIGNRKTATVNSQTSNYSANLLNQYDSRTVPGIIDVLGAAQPDATVTVTYPPGSLNILPTTRQGELFHRQIPVDNAGTARFTTATITGVKNNVGPNGEDAVTEETRSLLIPGTPEQFIHDADGNLTADAKWSYTWDGENRLVAMETSAAATAAGGPRRKLEFAYDGQSRRIAKNVYDWDGTAWLLGSSTRFLYDGWNMIAELDASSSNAATRTYAWGLDLSGSSQGAGGVGGLLFAGLQLQSSSSTYAPAYDGNGNVIGYVDMATGAKSATYEYGAFGETLIADGVAAEAMPFRFSTHYLDQETGLLYAKNRFIKDGRFLNRDPIAEQGGLNIYGFVGNDPVSRVDPFGLDYGGFPGMAPFGFGPIGPVHPPIAPDAFVPGWARVSGNYSITLSTLFGQGGTAAAYFPFPAAPAFGVYAKFDGTMKTGTCCKDGVKKSYSSLTGTITLGVYAGNPGTEFRITAPFVENLAQCPEPSALKLRGIAQGSVRLGPASFTVSVNGDGNVSFSGSYQVPVNLFTARASIGGGIQGSWAQINN